MQSYDYHPPIPLPDAEAPEQSLGDCAICMDSILVDPALRQRPEEKSDGLARRTGSLFVQSARKSYSLAPCHHLFVSSSLAMKGRILLKLCSSQHTACLERVSPCRRLKVEQTLMPVIPTVVSDKGAQPTHPVLSVSNSHACDQNICPQCRRRLPPL